ncbi:MAG TPA: LacI family DNA-binding transcriptional regulator [Chthoniobacterales bacterium]
MKSQQPNLKLLRQAIHLDFQDDVPLHVQLRHGLSMAIQNYFQDGQRFFNEKDIMEQLNVSQVTVRRALGDLVQERLLERRAAVGSFVRKRHLQEQSVDRVTLLAPDWDSSFIISLIHECTRFCQLAGLQADTVLALQDGNMVGSSGNDQTLAPNIPLIAIALDPHFCLDLYHRFGNRRRIVNIDAWSENYPGPYVGTDFSQMIRIGLDHLQGLGHSRICLLVNENVECASVADSVKHFEAQCRRRKLRECHVVTCGTKTWESSHDKVFPMMPKVMALRPRPTAIFAFDDQGAWAALLWLARNGIKVPEEMSVLGFSDDRPSKYTYPPLTTIAQSAREIAEIAVKMVGQKTISPLHHFLEPSLVVRESTAPPPDKKTA